MSRSHAPGSEGAPDAATRAVFSGSPLRSRIVVALVALGVALSLAWVVVAAVGVGDVPDRMPPRRAVRSLVVTSPIPGGIARA